MQKVVGSSPIIRFLKWPANAGHLLSREATHPGAWQQNGNAWRQPLGRPAGVGVTYFFLSLPGRLSNFSAATVAPTVATPPTTSLQMERRRASGGAHTSRTMMLAELRELLGSTPEDATKDDHHGAVLEGNVPACVPLRRQAAVSGRTL
jgi:hypothetical protein